MMAAGFVYLAAALVGVPLARRLGLGSVLGYLLAGIAIGPYALGLAGDAASVMHFAELGVVMMLFLIGLELDPRTLWRLRGPIFGMGGLQVFGTGALLAGAGMAAGLAWQPALAAGLVLSMSSTAIGLQSLQERGLLRSDAGQKSFAVLLFQDVAVIPLLALFPLLATFPPAAAAAGHGGGWVESLSAGGRALAVAGAVGGTIGAGRFLVGPLMRAVASTGQRELFLAAALLIVVGVSLLMQAVGLSPALGAFLAGVALAGSEYRHELQSDVEPFKGLLLGVFFLAVGAGIDFRLVAAAPGRIALAFLVVSAVKIGVLWALARGARSSRVESARFAAALGQVGEFAFVLLAFCEGAGVLPGPTARELVAVTALSMAAGPLIILFADRVLVPRLGSVAAAAAGGEPPVDAQNPVIVAGAGRFGQVVGRLLRAQGHAVTMLDVDSDQLAVLARFGTKVWFGDARRQDLLHAAGAHQAGLLVVAVEDHAAAVEIVRVARAHFPHLPVLARARGRVEAYELHALGVEGVFREVFDSSLRMGEAALRVLGHGAHAAHRAANVFRRHDEAAVVALASLRQDTGALVNSARERIAALEQAMAADRREAGELADHAFDTGGLRAWATQPAAPKPEGGA
jgi:monovalent cation:proton antiporter-2 (CPA2) family protein